MGKTALGGYTSSWICPHGHETEVWLTRVEVGSEGILRGGLGGSAWDFCDGSPGADGYCSDGPSEEQADLCRMHIASQVMAERGEYSAEWVEEEFVRRLKETPPAECICHE